MAILVDGFDDQLLGGTGYSPLGSLRTWLERLGDRGVTVVSARSSYYLNQYRSSINRAEAADQLAARHRVAHVQPWEEADVLEYLGEVGLDGSLVKELPHGQIVLYCAYRSPRVFAERCRRGDVSFRGGDFSLVEHLLAQYLHRESAKIKGRDARGVLISKAELERTFEWCAELMLERADRTLDGSNLELAADMALDGLLKNVKDFASVYLFSVASRPRDRGIRALLFRTSYSLTISWPARFALTLLMRTAQSISTACLPRRHGVMPRFSGSLYLGLSAISWIWSPIAIRQILWR